jgi:hypothetical protein
MSRIPRVVPKVADPSDPSVGDELARLEAYRSYLLAMADDQDRSRAKSRAMVRLIVPVLMVGLAILLFVWVRSDQMAVPTAAWTFVITGLLLFVLTRAFHLSGRPSIAGYVMLIVDVLTGPPFSMPVIRPDARELLAECEAQISKLRERRS